MQIVLDFLEDLTAHNNREWMQENKKYYQEAKSTFEGVVNQLIDGIATFDEEVANLTPKDCMFRINRDIRFSKDKSPYKTNFGAAISPGGKKSQGAMYYCHIQPANCFIAGGIYMPQSDALAKIRQEIDYNPESLKRIVSETTFSKTWGEITGDELKTAPKGYPKDHPNIELIRKKSFVVMKNLSDEDVLKSGFAQAATQSYQILYPLNQYLSVAIS